MATPRASRRGLGDDAVGPAAAVDFPDQRAADDPAATSDQHTASLPVVLVFGRRHILELCAALLYSTGLSPWRGRAFLSRQSRRRGMRRGPRLSPGGRRAAGPEDVAA